MPRKNKLSVDEAIKIIIDFSEYFCNDTLPEYSNAVWQQMSNKCGKLWSAHYWWISVTQNRRKIFSLARREMGLDIFPDIAINITNEDNKSINISNISVDSTCEENEAFFNLILNSEEWEQIKPLQLDDKRSNHTLRPWVWTNIVADAFYWQYRLPCAYTFVRGEVNVSSVRKYFIKITGKCKSKNCGNIFKGFADSEPSSISGKLYIRVETQDTRGKSHEIVQRPLNGEKQKQIGKETIGEGCSNLRKRLARENLRFGDSQHQPYLH